jgi:peroxiredoxin/DNA-binding transcriptional MerR regulator
VRAGQAATAAGVSIKALRYDESLGLLVPQRLPNGYRDYSEDDVRAAAQIRQLTALGLSPVQAEPFPDCLRTGHPTGDDCPESLAAYQATLDRLDALITQLTRTRERVAGQLLTAARRGFASCAPDDPPSKEAPPMTSVPLPQPDPLPDGLPAPVDDGAARHLPGRVLPPLVFTTTGGDQIRLDAVSSGRWVLYVYPLAGEPGVDMPRGWNEIPGARGCSQEACSFRDNLAALQAVGAQRVLALSTDRAEYQRDLVARLHLPYPMVSDPELSLAEALDLPTFTAAGMELYKRLTLVLDGDRIEHVFYPVFPPGEHAEEVLRWLREHPGASR